jgi:hypothetical protein
MTGGLKMTHMDSMAANIWARIGDTCSIRHQWHDNEVSFLFHEGDGGVGLELDVTDVGFDQLVAAVEQARAARATESADQARPFRHLAKN